MVVNRTFIIKLVLFLERAHAHSEIRGKKKKNSEPLKLKKS